MFFIGRSRPKQLLNLSRKAQNNELGAASVKGISEKPENESGTKKSLVDEVAQNISGVEVTQNSNPKSRNKLGDEIVYFVYNGHEWEAHEVLGVESGKSLEEITLHYQHLIKTSDPSTFEFYEAAYSAVLNLKNPKW